jgi:D-glycero-beta-D-manno-heptose 1-phosphate adenylyltransferase
MNLTRARLIEDWTAGILREYEAMTGRSISLPVPIFDIVEQLYALRCDIENLKGKLARASGVLIPEKRWIILNKQQSPNRVSFTLAHELAHWVIECQPVKHSKHSLEHITGLRSSDDRIRERMADRVAGALLMPRKMLLDSVRTLKTVGGAEVSELAAMFGVSRAAMCVRLSQIEPDLWNLGVRRQFSEKKRQGMYGYSHRSKDRDTTRVKAAIIKVDYSVIDHDLYRKLLAFKKICDYLYVVLDDKGNCDEDVLIDFECVDGFAYLEGDQFKDPQREIFSSSGADVLFRTLVSGNWLERLLRDNQDGTRDRDGAYVVTLRDNDRVQVKKQTLLDISWYVEPPARLNYRKDAKLFVKNAKEIGKRVVIVTGCFDLLTKCHVRFLKRAKATGDVLVVGIEDDTRVRAFKGPLRPVNTISQRVEVVEALEFVDFTFVISGSPKMPLKPFYTRLHKLIKADILAVTDGDPYLQDRQDEIEAAGGQLAVVSHFEDGSSTSLLRRLLAKIEYSDLFLVSKRQLKAYEVEHKSNWRQLRLPLDGFK